MYAARERMAARGYIEGEKKRAPRMNKTVRWEPVS